MTTSSLFRLPARLLTAAALLVALGSQALVAQQPDTPAAKQLTRWLETFNANDRAARLKYLQENQPSRAANIEQDMGMRARTGGFEFIRWDTTTATRAVAILRDRDVEATGVRMAIEVEAAAPYKIVQAQLQPGVDIGVRIPHLSEGDLAKAVDAEVKRRGEAGRFSGTVMVAKAGKPIYSGAVGQADRAKGVANTMETRFRNGSMNKMFTATAIMTLVQAGKVKLDATLGTYLTDYPNKTVASKVTIHHLLTHTGGTGDIFGPQFMEKRKQLRTHQDYLDLYGTRDLAYEPGARWAYSNYGFVLLGAIIEKVTGQSYYDYVRDHVYKPAGMTQTASDPEDSPVNGRSTGYMQGPNGPNSQPNDETLPWRGTAAGGGYTTVGDLIRFANALLTNAILDEKHTDLLLTGKVDAAFGGKYAYGFIDRTVNGQRAVGHGGGAPGMNGDLVIFPETGYAVAALANLDPPAAQRVADFAASRVPTTMVP